MSQIKILALGDVVGENAVEYIRRRLGRFCDDNAIDFTVINGENACMGQGNGIDVVSAKTLLQSGADVITSGNHIWHKKDMREYFDVVVIRGQWDSTLSAPISNAYQELLTISGRI